MSNTQETSSALDKRILRTQAQRSQTGQVWHPILPKELVPAAMDCITAIAGEVASGVNGSPSPVILCEQALLFAYLSKAGFGDGWDEKAIDCLNQAIEQISLSGQFAHLWFFGGLAQVGWVVEHVSDILEEGAHQLVVADEKEELEDPISEVDDVIIRRIERESWIGQYDLISGLVGLGVYFLQRLPRSSALRGIGLVLDQLEKTAVEVWSGISWFTPPEMLPPQQLEACPSGYYNLGVAHGVPGIMSFLADVIAHEIEVARAKRLLEGSVRWLFAQERPPQALYRYSSWIVPGQEPLDSRLAWCYGDLGIGAVLHRAGSQIGRPEWCKAAEQLFEHCFLLPPDKTFVRDAPLCHGAAGVGHILNRIYQAEGDPRHKDIANLWFERTLALRQPGSGIGGFSTFTPEKSPVWDPDPSFLGGAIGIALALLSAICPVEPQWDRALLLSSRPIIL